MSGPTPSAAGEPPRSTHGASPASGSVDTTRYVDRYEPGRAVGVTDDRLD